MAHDQERLRAEFIEHIHSVGFETFDKVMYTTRPVTLPEAKEILTVDLPADATNIEFYGYHEWQAHTVFLKFNASAESLYLFAKHTCNVPPEPLQSVPPQSAGGSTALPSQVTWFAPDKIKHGFQSMIGAGNGTPRKYIWIDSDRMVVYYEEED